MAKRYLQSDSKSTMFPNYMELVKAFKYGTDYLERTNETATNLFWLDVR